MKPHEETWRVDGYMLLATIDGVERGIAEFTYRDENNGRLKRCEFAAHAPVMYRALAQVLDLAKDVNAGGDPEAILEAIIGIASRVKTDAEGGNKKLKGDAHARGNGIEASRDVLEGEPSQGAPAEDAGSE